MQRNIAFALLAIVAVILCVPSSGAAAFCKCCLPPCGPSTCYGCDSGWVVCGSCYTCTGRGCVIAAPADVSEASTTRGMSVGIDLAVRQGGTFINKALFASPAFEAGLRGGDQILEINGRDAKGISYREARRLLEEAKQGSVTLLVVTGQRVRTYVLHPESMLALSGRIRLRRSEFAEQRFGR